MNKVIEKGFRSCRFVSTIVKHPVIYTRLFALRCWRTSSTGGCAWTATSFFIMSLLEWVWVVERQYFNFKVLLPWLQMAHFYMYALLQNWGVSKTWYTSICQNLWGETLPYLQLRHLLKSASSRQRISNVPLNSQRSKDLYFYEVHEKCK